MNKQLSCQHILDIKNCGAEEKTLMMLPPIIYRPILKGPTYPKMLDLYSLLQAYRLWILTLGSKEMQACDNSIWVRIRNRRARNCRKKKIIG